MLKIEKWGLPPRGRGNVNKSQQLRTPFLRRLKRLNAPPIPFRPRRQFAGQEIAPKLGACPQPLELGPLLGPGPPRPLRCRQRVGGLLRISLCSLSVRGRERSCRHCVGRWGGVLPSGRNPSGCVHLAADPRRPCPKLGALHSTVNAGPLSLWPTASPWAG